MQGFLICDITLRRVAELQANSKSQMPNRYVFDNKTQVRSESEKKWNGKLKEWYE